jgi:predicted dehydrogenase
MQAFVKAVRKGEAGSPTLRDACQAMVVCEAICDSIERRVAVDVER